MLTICFVCKSGNFRQPKFLIIFANGKGMGYSFFPSFFLVSSLLECLSDRGLSRGAVVSNRHVLTGCGVTLSHNSESTRTQARVVSGGLLGGWYRMAPGPGSFINPHPSHAGSPGAACRGGRLWQQSLHRLEDVDQARHVIPPSSQSGNAPTMQENKYTRVSR